MATTTALVAAGCGGAGSSVTSDGSVSTSSASTGSASTSSVPTSSVPTSSASTGSASPAGKVTVYGCDQQPVAQPKTYILSCGDGGVVLNQLTWTGWGTAKASATGVRTQNSCVPTCAAGSPISTEASVTLSGLAAGHYTKLHVVTAKGTSDYTIDAQGPLTTN